MDHARLGHFDLLGQIGEGGMGRVYKARDTRLERLVAIKLLPETKVADVERRARFVQEAKAASALNHPNIITIYEIGEQDGQTFIVMELVDGQPLTELIGRKTLRLKDTLRIATQVADALAAAHKAGIVHRDLKPANIMVDAQGRAKLLDFGLAKLAPAGPASAEGTTQTVVRHRSLTEEGAILGSVPYMSPEQAEGKPLDARSDIFSFGAVLYEMVTGQRAFRGESRASTLAAVVEKDPPPPSEITGGTPPELERLITRCLRKDLHRRSQHMADVKLALEELRDDSDSGKLGRALGTPEAAVRPWRRTWWWLGAMAAAVLITAVVWSVMRSSNAAGPSGSAASAVGFTVQKLDGLGDVGSLTISDDEKYLAYTTDTGGQSTMWLRQMVTGSVVKITEPTDHLIEGLQFTPDGSFLYYTEVVGAQGARKLRRLNAIPILGGTPKRILEGDLTAEGISFAPDGKRFVTVKYTDKDSILTVFNADGTGEQPIGTRPSETRYGGPVWSPSGKMLAVVVRKDAVGARSEIQIIPASGGTPRTLNPSGSPLQQVLLDVSWTSDDGLVGRNTPRPGSPVQIWTIRVSDGVVQPLTNDTSAYLGLSVARQTGTIISRTHTSFGSMWIGSTERPDEAKEIPSRLSDQDGSRGIAWVSNDRLAFTRASSGHGNVWVSNADGTAARKLTDDAGGNYPAVTPDHLSIVFDRWFSTSNCEIFSVPVTGGPVTQITHEEGCACCPTVTPDGQTLVFVVLRFPAPPVLKTMPLAGGIATTLLESRATVFHLPKASPDGKWTVANVETKDAPGFRSVLVPLAGGSPLPVPVPTWAGFENWFPNGKALLVSKVEAGVGNFWRVELGPLPGPGQIGLARQLTHFTRNDPLLPAFSPDGKRIAFYRGFTETDVVLLRMKR